MDFGKADAKDREISNLQIEVVELRAQLHERPLYCSQVAPQLSGCVHLGRAEMVCTRSQLESGRCEGVHWQEANEQLCPTAGAGWARNEIKFAPTM